MLQVGQIEAGSRHDLHVGLSPDAPDESALQEDPQGAFGYCHSYETASRYDGPGLRVVLFTSGCLLRCSYCHNPDTWHLKDGTYVAAQKVIDRLAKFAHALRALDGGLTISGGEPMVQLAFTRRILTGAKQLGLHTAIETSGYLGDRADDRYLSVLDLVLLDIKSSNPETYRTVTGRDLAPTLRFAERLASMGKPVWVRFTLVPGLTDDPANIDGIARFVAPMKNVAWVEVQPLHQLGASLLWVMPLPANIVLRNFGLALFLATVGVNAGQPFVKTVSETGLLLLLIGVAVLLATVVIVLLVGHYLMRIPYDDLLGIASGATGNPAILVYSTRMAPTERPDIGYAMIFPSMTIVKVVAVQIVGLLFGVGAGG